MKLSLFIIFSFSLSFTVFEQVPVRLGDCYSYPNPRKCIEEGITSTKTFLKIPHRSKLFGWSNLCELYLGLSKIDLLTSDYTKVFENLRLSKLYLDSLETLGEKANEHVTGLKQQTHYVHNELCTKLYKNNKVTFYNCAYCKPFFPKNDEMNSVQKEDIFRTKKEPVSLNSEITKGDSLKRQELIKKQFAEREAIARERDLVIRKANERAKQIRYNAFIYDSLGRLRLDPNLSIGMAECKQLKDNREIISATLVNALLSYEAKLYKEVLPKINYQASELIPFQIKDTTRHLYKITCDSNGILKIEHSLLSNNRAFGDKADTMFQIALASIFPFLKIKDAKIHEYYIPIIYIPFRYRHPMCSYYFCNCQFNNGFVYPDILNCESSVGYKVESTSFDKGLFTPNSNCKWDEFYFTITDGKPLVPCPEVAIKQEPQIITPIRSKREERRYLKNKQ